MRSWFAPFAFGLMTACTVSTAPQLRPLPESSFVELPPMKLFGTTQVLPVERSNQELARDFIDLSFTLESGAQLPALTRFESPVTIAVRGRPTSIFNRELDRLVTRLQRETGIDITRLPDNSTAAITVEPISREDLQRSVPEAACFVLPARITWREFHGNMRRRDLNWSDLEHRIAATVFVPVDVSPQEIRDCLHEEIAQALGPLNDLYRLDDSIFNDDNLQSILTGFDMLMLRVTYDPALKTGMTREQVEPLLPGILQRLNPGGSRYATRQLSRTPRSWIDAIEYALGNHGAGRRAAGARALAIAREYDWNDTRMGLSLFTLARLDTPYDGTEALEGYVEAASVYSQRNATRIHEAHVAMQLAAFALAGGQTGVAISLADQFIPVARRAENAALLSDLLAVKATALEAEGRTAEAKIARLDSLGWGRYGSRSVEDLRLREAEIAALLPRPQTGG